MERWSGKVAVVTGASSGIGAAIAVQLLKAGVIVVGLARRADRIKALAAKVPAAVAKNLHAHKCDISVEADIVAAFAWIKSNLGGVDIMVNNSGIFGAGNLLDAGNTEMLTSTLNTNVVGLVLCTREAHKSMKERNVAGHVVLINSVLGHLVPARESSIFGSLNLYAPSKFAVTAITEVLRQEFNAEKSKTKITSISPGFVMSDGVPEQLRSSGVAHLQPEDIASAVLYALGTPPHVQVHDLQIKPVGERF